MMKYNGMLMMFFLLATSLVAPSPLQAQDNKDAFAVDEEKAAKTQSPRLIQGLIGVMEFDSDSYDLVDANGDRYTSDMPTIPFLGGMWQNSYLHGDVVSLGGEAGILFGFVNDSTTLTSVGNSNVIHISVKNKFFVVDTMFGLNMDIHPSEKFRIYGGAGPLLLYGNLKTDNQDDEASTQIVEDSSNSDFDIGLYGRIGTDILLGETTRFGVQVRYVDAELDFGSKQGQVDMTGVQYMVTFTEKF